MRGGFWNSGRKKEGPQIKARKAPDVASNLMRRPAFEPERNDIRLRGVGFG
jgi:hypothetical protein